MRAAFVKREWENSLHTIISFYFKPLVPYRYEAGQYAVISVPHEQPDDRGISRTMTFSSSPDEELLKITMRVISSDGNHDSSYKRTLLGLNPPTPTTAGDEVIIFAALGDMVLPLDTTIPLVFVAGGVGIASYAGIMQWLAASGERRDITLLYTVARPEDIVLQTPFETYAARQPEALTRYLHTPPVNGDTPAGLVAFEKSGGIIKHTRLEAADILSALKPDSLIYLSGTEPMVNSWRGGLKQAGIPHSRVVFDYFEGYTEL